ncbi:hypothetical protein ACFLVG_00230 [Chloroflexota bacterium]
MGKLLSLHIAIPSVLILCFGGLGVVGTMEICNFWAYAIWGLGLLWFVGLIIYLPQRIVVRGLGCEYDEPPNGELYLIVSGFINARHTDALQAIYLYLPERKIDSDRHYAFTVPRYDWSINIGSYFQKFKTRFMISEGDQNQNKGKPKDDWAILGFMTAEREYVTKSFKIPGKVVKRVNLQKRKDIYKEQPISQQEFSKSLTK